MQPLLDEALELLRQYAKEKGAARLEWLELQATANHHNEPLALDISTFNRLVTELSQSKDQLSVGAIEHKLILISVFASNISSEFNNLISKIDAVIDPGVDSPDRG